MRVQIVIVFTITLVIFPIGSGSQISTQLTQLSYSADLGVVGETDYFWWDVGGISGYPYESAIQFTDRDLGINSHVELWMYPPFDNIITIPNRSNDFELSADDNVISFTDGEFDLPNLLLDLLVTPTEGVLKNGNTLSGFDLIDYYLLPKFTSYFGIAFTNQSAELTSIDIQWNSGHALVSLEIFNSSRYHFISFTNYGLVTQYFQVLSPQDGTSSGFSLLLTDTTGRLYVPWFFELHPNITKMESWVSKPLDPVTTITSTTSATDPHTATSSTDPHISTTSTMTTTGLTSSTSSDSFPPKNSVSTATFSGQLGLFGITQMIILLILVVSLPRLKRSFVDRRSI